MKNLNKHLFRQPDRMKAKPASIQSWENEGGAVIPTGKLPALLFDNTESNVVADKQPEQLLHNGKKDDEGEEGGNSYLILY